VTVARATTRDVPVKIEAIGTLEATTTVNVKPLVGGELVTVGFSEGQTVRRGQLLFRIDPQPYHAVLAEARARLAGDEARAVDADRELDRAAKLRGRHVVSAADLDKAKAAAAALHATIALDRAAVVAARIDLGHCSIRSPITGRTGALLVHRGNIVKANDAPLVVIKQLRPIEASFSVPGRYLPLLLNRRAALEATIRRQNDHAAYHGQVTFVDNTVDPSTGTVTLKATLSNDNEQLWPGEFVDVSLRLEQQHNVVVVPTQAVQTGQQGNYVFLVKSDDTVWQQAVKLGPEADGVVAVKRGVSAGQTVVTDGQLRLRPGMKIARREALRTEARQ
jgi:multidrug efflux system membrane fusion protein